MKKIIHISNTLDFTINAYRTYEKAYPGQNKILIIHPFWPRPRKNTLENVEYMNAHIFHLKLNEIAKKNDLVVLHSMNYWNTLFFLKNTNIKIIPILFGFEVAMNKLIKSEFYQEYEKHIVRDNFVKRAYKFLNWGFYHSQKLINLNFIKFLGQTKILGTYENEFDFLVKNKYVKKNTQFFNFQYFPAEQMIEEIDLSIEVGENILIGHSGDPTSNQIETLKELKALDLGVRKLITPLSYGSKSHIAKVKSYGEKNLPTNFKPIQDLMPLKEYNELLQSCGYVIMNQKTTTGYGNILTALFLGSRVFVNCESIYDDLKNWGVIVYKPEDFFSMKIEKLNSKEIEHNRNILIEYIGEEALKKKIKKIIAL
tara:strand:+ start:774 stop:1880 length:1107 start_codon:yes stop_codon:yes gene_type:complete